MLIPESESGDYIADARSAWVLRDGQPAEVLLTLGLSNGVVTEVLGGDIRSGDLLITDRIDG